MFSSHTPILKEAQMEIIEGGAGCKWAIYLQTKRTLMLGLVKDEPVILLEVLRKNVFFLVYSLSINESSYKL